MRLHPRSAHHSSYAKTDPASSRSGAKRFRRCRIEWLNRTPGRNFSGWAGEKHPIYRRGSDRSDGGGATQRGRWSGLSVNRKNNRRPHAATSSNWSSRRWSSMKGLLQRSLPASPVTSPHGPPDSPPGYRARSVCTGTFSLRRCFLPPLKGRVESHALRQRCLTTSAHHPRSAILTRIVATRTMCPTSPTARWTRSTESPSP